MLICTCILSTGGGAYWEGRAIVSPLFGPNGQTILLALPLFAAPK